MKHYKRMEEKLQETFDRAASVRKWAQRVCGSLRSKRFRLVSEQRKTEERDSRFWPREKWNKSQKMKVGGGGGEGRKRLQTNPSILKTCVRQRTQRLIGSVSRTMLTCVDQRFVSYWEEGMVGFQWLLFILVRKICPPMQEHFLWLDLFWNVRLSLRLNKGFRSFNLIWITKSDFLLLSNAMVSSNVSCWAQLVSVFFFQGCWIDGDLQTVLLGGLKRQMSKACVIGFTYASSEVHFRSTESQTFYRSIMTADDSIKCRCEKSGMTGQVGGFQNPGVCLQAFPSFLPHPLPLFYLRHFSRGIWLSFLVLCS